MENCTYLSEESEPIASFVSRVPLDFHIVKNLKKMGINSLLPVQVALVPKVFISNYYDSAPSQSFDSLWKYRRRRFVGQGANWKRKNSRLCYSNHSSRSFFNSLAYLIQVPVASKSSMFALPRCRSHARPSATSI